MTGVPEREQLVTKPSSPAADRAPVTGGRQPADQAASSPVASAGNATIARRMRGCPADVRVVSNPLVGNGAISRALGSPGGAGNSAPNGFGERLGSAESGQAIPEESRESLESAFGTSLKGVRLHVGSRAAELAAEVNADAFTVGQDIYFGQGNFQPGSERGYQLLAHEVTHTLQPGGNGGRSAAEPTVSDPADASEREAEEVARRVTAARTGGSPEAAPRAAAHSGVLRDISATDVIPDFILDGVKSAVSAIPGYVLLGYITGKDPLTDAPVHVGHQELVDKLLAYGPFGAGVGQVLRAAEVLGDVYSLVTSELGSHNLTLARIGHDIGAAWDELSVTKGIDGNVAIVRRYVNAILDDVAAFVRSIVDRVIEMVRAVAADIAEPHLQRPQIKPVWELARKVLHYDPLRGEEVSAPTVEILGDFLRLIGKEQVLAQMTERGTLQQTADWLDAQFATFVGIKNDLLTLFRDAWAAIQPQNLPNLLDTLPSLAQRAFALVQRIAAFASTVIGKVLELIKKSLLGWLSSHAYEIPGFRLLTVMIERNPFTDERVARTAANLIGGFIALLPNGEATYRQLAESGVIGEAAGRIESAMTRLGITVELITSTFRGIWDTLSLEDLLAPIPAFERVLARFREPLSRIVAFVSEVVQVVISLILKLMNFPSDLLGSIINNAMQAIEDIKRDPVAFLLNMLQALKGGFIGFFDNILTFLLDGLTSWLFRGLGALGITRPPDLSLQSILTLVLQVLGITVEKLWQKLGQHLGPERVAQIRGGIDKLTGAWAFIKEVQAEGVAAIWRYVTEKLSGLWDTVINLAKNWIMTEIVERVTARLISMLDPTGVMAVINSFIAFFNAIQSAIEYLRDILEIVNQYVTTFAQVAAGNILPGAAKVTQGLANAVPIAIGFLANQVGIGNVPEKVVEIIGGLRDLIDEAMDWLIQNAISLGQSALTALGFGGPETPGADPAEGDVRGQATAALLAELGQAHPPEQIQPIIAGIEERFRPAGLKRIVVGQANEQGDYPILIEASPLAPAVLMRLIRPGGTVRARAELKFDQAVTLNTPRRYHTAYQTRTQNKKRVNVPVPHPSGGFVQVAEGDSDLPEARIVHPDPVAQQHTDQLPAPEQITTDVLQVVSRNFALPPNSREHNNNSHAEYQMITQLMREIPDWSLLKSVEMHISRMPCEQCCVTLSRWLDLIPGATVNISYTQTHPVNLGDEVNFPTSAADLDVLRRPNVTLVGPPALFATRAEADTAASRRAVPIR